MQTTSQRRFFQSIKFKLLLVALTLFSIPWAGYRYIEETETFLRQAREKLLLDTAQSIATLLHNNDEFFNLPGGVSEAIPKDRLLYAHPLTTQIQLDGYPDDWSAYLAHARHLGSNHVLQRARTDTVPSVAVDLLLGVRERYLYILVRVQDDQIVYKRPYSGASERNDHLQLFLRSPQGRRLGFRVSTSAPGWIEVTRIPLATATPNDANGTLRIQGEWQESENGYTVEIRIPRGLVGGRMTIGVADVDDAESGEILSIIGIGDLNGSRDSGVLVMPSEDIQKIIDGLEHENARIWVLDGKRQVLAQRGRLKEETRDVDIEKRPVNLLHSLFRRVLRQPRNDFRDDLSNATELSGRHIDAALSNRPLSAQRSTPDNKALILSAAYPVQGHAAVIGAVVVEQTTNDILSLQNKALERLFGITLVTFVVTSLLLLGFASILTKRILNVRERVDQAVSDDGRIRGEFRSDRSRDELGDMERSFSSVLNRLNEYNRYLETMASRLAHEMRTPLSMVKSSLENLQMTVASDSCGPYLNRANEGVDRLAKILNQMREATRLEQALQSTEKEDFDPLQFFRAAYAGYNSVYPEIDFTLDAPHHCSRMRGAPDLINQALDKMVANAVDFHTPETAITLRLTCADMQRIGFSVINQGPSLPDNMREELFGSMISVRSGTLDEPHLGMGLYLVQIISEYHGGKASATNLPDNTGVEFSMRLGLD